MPVLVVSRGGGRRDELAVAGPDLALGRDLALVEQGHEDVQVLPHVADRPLERDAIAALDAGLVGQADPQGDVAYFILQSMVTAFGYSTALPAVIAAWTSNIIFLISYRFCTIWG